MPRHREAKKDAANSEMRRLAVSMQRETQGTETSKYLKEEKINE